MKTQFAVIGLGVFGAEVARTLAKHKYSVLAIDKDENKVKDIADAVTIAVQLDATNEKALREAGVQDVDVAIVSMGENIEASILIIMLLKELGIPNIIAKAANDLYERVLKQIGLKMVVRPERDMAQKVAHSLIRPEFLEFIDLSPEYSIAEIPAAKSLWKKTLDDNDFRANYGISVVAIKRLDKDGSGESNWNVTPLATDVIEEGDVLVILGKNENIEKFSEVK